MKAMIFAAGLGTRLRPITNDRPKAMAEIHGTPLLEIIIRRLKNYGFDEIIINAIIRHLAAQSAKRGTHGQAEEGDKEDQTE